MTFRSAFIWSALFAVHIVTLASIYLMTERDKAHDDLMRQGILGLYQNQIILQNACKGTWT